MIAKIKVIDADFAPQVVYNDELRFYLDNYKDMTLVSYSALLNGLYNKDSINEPAYQTTYNNKIDNPNLFVLDYVIHLL